MSDNPTEKRPRGDAGKDAKNQGEGDKESARRYNKMQEEFVKSPAGREAIEHAGDVSSAEQADLEQAEQAGKQRAKGEDPAVKRERPGK